MTIRMFPATIAALAVLAAACGSPDDSSRKNAAPGARSAAASPNDAAGPRRRADRNRDGRVSRKEAQSDPYLAASFDRYDADKNESLDRAEFARLESDAIDEGRDVDDPSDERHQLRPRDEFPRPLQ